MKKSKMNVISTYTTELDGKKYKTCKRRKKSLVETVGYLILNFNVRQSEKQ